MRVIIEQKQNGLYLSAKTENGNYSQYYTTTKPNSRLFVNNEAEAIQRFIRFYSQFGA